MPTAPTTPEGQCSRHWEDVLDLTFEEGFGEEPNMDRETEQPLNTRGAAVEQKAPRAQLVFRRVGIPIIAATLSVAILVGIAFLIKAAVESEYFFCSQTWRFVPLSRLCDGFVDCAAGEDEAGCVQQMPEGAPTRVRLSRQQSGLQVQSRETGLWAWTCHDSFTAEMAVAACRELGYSSAPSFRAAALGDLQGLPLQEVTLRGGEFHWRDSDGRQCPSGTSVSLSCGGCGENRRAPRVLDGAPAEIGRWPWQASLQLRGRHVCGGSFVGERWVLTAAHCFRDQLLTRHWTVKGGSESLSSAPSAPVEKVFVIDITSMYPKDEDIALVKLQRPLRAAEPVKPICLPFFDEELPPGTPLWVTGWGYTHENGQLAKTLQQVRVELIDSSACNAANAYHGDVTENMLCAGGGGADTCQGDSGGPLMHEEDHWHLVGVVSWGHGCGSPTTPGVYTKVQSYLNWIYAVRKAEL